MNTVLEVSKQNALPVSVRLVRLIVSVLSVTALLTEVTLSGFWQSVLAALAVYAFVTGVFGRDPLFVLLGHRGHRIPGDAQSINRNPNPAHGLNRVAQLECLTVGLVCFVVGIMHSHTGSMIFLLLPFLGIYPIVLCIVRHDLLDYLLQSYRKDLGMGRQE